MGDFALTRYGRFWAVYDETGSLVCLTVYKKGAREVIRRLSPPDLPDEHPVASQEETADSLSAPRAARCRSRAYAPSQ